MSFANLFAKLSDLEKEEPRQTNNVNLGQGISRKRKPQKQPGSDVKRECLRSSAARSIVVSPEEEPTTSGTHRRPRSSVSSAQASKHDNRTFRSNDHNKGNANYGYNQKKTYNGGKRQENAQRYRNSYNTRRERDACFSEPRKRFMTQEFKDQHVVEVEGRLLCKYHLMGRCTKGEECQLEHTKGHNDLVKEPCKFYIQASCYKGADCPYMHKSIPCKFFHIKSRCNLNDCRFSHDPLTSMTQKVLDALIQRETELVQLNRTAEEPVSQTVNEEQTKNDDITTPYVRPSFYQSSETAVEDEALPPDNETQSDKNEEDSALQENNIESEDSLPSASLDQPAPVCYSVEAVLGPQLFKPVLYTDTQSPKFARFPPKTTTRVNPLNAPYSVANVLRSQSGAFTSHLYTPLHVTAKSGHYEKECHNKAPSGTKRNREANETQEGTAISPNLTLVPDQSTAHCDREHLPPADSSIPQKCQIPKELHVDKLGDCGQEDASLSSLHNEKSVCNSLPTIQATAVQQRETTGQSSHTAQNVAEKRQDCRLGSNVPSARDKTTSRFSHLFANLNSGSDRTSSAGSSDKRLMPNAKKALKSDFYSQKVHQTTKPSQCGKAAAKATNNGSCKNEEAESWAVSTETSHDNCHKPVSFSANTKGQHKEEDTESATTPGKSFQSLFTSLTADVDQTLTVADAFSDKPAVSSAKKLEKSKRDCQKALPSQFMENTLEITNGCGSSKEGDVRFATAISETSDNSQKSISSYATPNSKRKSKKGCIQSAETPPKSFQSLFASLPPQLEGASSLCGNLSGKPTVSNAQNIEKSIWTESGFKQAAETREFPRSRTESADKDKGVGLVASCWETSNNSNQTSVSSSARPNLKNRQETNIEKAKTPAKSFQSLFAAPLDKATAKNDSNIGLTEPLQSTDSTLSQSKRSQIISSQKTVDDMTEEGKHEHKKETATSPSSNVSDRTSASRSPLHQSHTGPVKSVFQTLFQQLRPYEEHEEHQDSAQRK